MDIFSRSVSYLPGVGKVRAAALERLGIHSVGDLLYHFPRAYQNRGDVKTLYEAGQTEDYCSMVLTVGSSPTAVRLPGNKIMIKFTAFDETGKVPVCFFNQTYVKDVFRLGTAFRFWGKLSVKRGNYFLSSPEFEPYSESYRLPDYNPVYPLTEGISQKYLQNLIGIVLSEGAELDDPIPEEMRKKENLPSLTEAMRIIHRPVDYSELDRARRRFMFEELYIYALGTRSVKRKDSEKTTISMSRVDFTPFTSQLGFLLTNGQKKAINEIYHDMVRSGKKMNRLLSGDVGSGKTVCAEAAAYIAMSNGYQVAIMAPTEILANQHYIEMEKMFSSLGFKTALLTGSLTPKQKKELKAGLLSGEIDLAVGTHALLTSDTVFRNLGLVVTDEQHRFGVSQRSALVSKTEGVHSLVMTATPIPRTLALILYGDLSISSITEMPKGRQKITTYLVGESKRGGMYEFIKKELDRGRQCYMVCPAIEPPKREENEGPVIDFWFDPLKSREEIPDIKNVTEYYEELTRTVFQNYRVGLMHGKMKAKDKDEVMARFVSGELQILISTTVIEVGVNVPNSTVMVIENAERYGLAQLHQLRGRVGRGRELSYCMLMSDTKPGSSGHERLTVLKNSQNGYEIAEYDLKVRGPGDYLAQSDGKIRQHGETGFRMASLCDDINLLAKATEAAEHTLDQSPSLTSEPNNPTALAMARMFQTKSNTVN